MAGMQKKRKPLFALWLLAAIVFLTAGGWLLITELPETKRLETQIQTVVSEQLGGESNTHNEHIADISVSRGLQGWNVAIVLNIDKEVQTNPAKIKLWQDALIILEPLSEINQLNNISLSWIFSAENISAMSFRLDKETRDQLIWENVDPSILPDITLDYQEHSLLNN